MNNEEKIVLEFIDWNRKYREIKEQLSSYSNFNISMFNSIGKKITSQMMIEKPVNIICSKNPTLKLTYEQLESIRKHYLPLSEEKYNYEISRNVLIDSCSFFEYTIGKIFYLSLCVKNLENDIENIKEEVDKKIRTNKYKVIKDIVENLNSEKAKNMIENSKFNKLDKNFKIIFTIRNNFIHNNNLMNSYLKDMITINNDENLSGEILQCNKVLAKIKELEIENKIEVSIKEVDSLVVIIRQVIEILLVSIAFEIIDKISDTNNKKKIEEAIKIHFIQESIT